MVAEGRRRYLHGLDKRADYVFGVGEMRRRFRHAIGELADATFN